MIKIYNRNTKNYDIEKVSGEKYLKWIYSSNIGASLLELLIKRKFFSFIYGKYCDSKLSHNKIEPFIKNFNINITESSTELNSFKTFNDFFTRKLTSCSRPISKDKNTLISPGDGRILAYNNIDLNNIVQIKGFTYTLKELINSETIDSKFDKGICLILRLNPTDYHRFHFIDDGICENSQKIKGSYYSVNPIALNKIENLFCKNKRNWSIFHSDNFKDILYVEIGATCVGSIIETYNPTKKVEKGSEKGFFKFGGSTVVLFLQKGSVNIDQDILNQTKEGYETKISLGEKIGLKIN